MYARTRPWLAPPWLRRPRHSLTCDRLWGFSVRPPPPPGTPRGPGCWRGYPPAARGFLAKRDIIVIGGSAGASAALHRLVAGLSPDLQASVFIVTHVPVHGAMLLRGLLEARTELPVVYAQDGDPILPGRIV